MAIYRKLVALLCVLAVVIAIAQCGVGASQTRGDESPRGESSSDSIPAVNRETVEGLRLSVLSISGDSIDAIRLRVALNNVSDKDTVLNLGMMLGNGRVQLPTAVRLILTDSGGDTRKLHFPVPNVGGRVDDFIVPLRAGSTYTLRLSLKDYWCPESKEFPLKLAPGSYGVCAEFIGTQAQHLNEDTEVLMFMPFWTGKLKSEVAQLQIGTQG